MRTTNSTMETKTILIVAAIIVVSGCVSQDGSDQPNTPETDQPETNADGDSRNIIYLTDSGFQPSDITVQTGEKVTWINNASSSMWVASDRHPSHTEYAGTSLGEHCSSEVTAFDQCSTGEEYSFTFEKEGQWGYHNHQPFIRGGKVTVR